MDGSVESVVLPDHRQSKLDEKKVREAVTALVAFHKKRTQEVKNELFLNEAGVIQLQLAVWKITGDKAKTIKIELPHSPHPKTTEACLFTKDVKGKNTEESVEHFNGLLQENNVKGVGEVIPLKLYRTEYKPYIARRQLVHKYDIFLADDRVFRLLHTHLGKEFYKRKKYPVCVNLLKKDLKTEIEGAIGASYFILSNRGDCNHFAVGRTDMTVDQITENIMAGVQCMVQHITNGWPNVKALYLKSKRSISLPIYSSLVFEDWSDDIVVDNKDLVKLRKQVESKTMADNETPKKRKRERGKQEDKPGKKPVLAEKPVPDKNKKQPKKEKKVKPKQPKRRASGKMLKKLKEKREQEGGRKDSSSEKNSGRTIRKELLAEKSKIKAKKGVKPPVVANPKIAKFTSKSKMDVKSKMAAKYKMGVTANEKKVKREIKKEAELAGQKIKKEGKSPVPEIKRETKPAAQKLKQDTKTKVKQETRSADSPKPAGFKRRSMVKKAKGPTGGMKSRMRTAKV